MRKQLMYNISKHKEEIVTNLISNAFWYFLSILITNMLLLFPLIKGAYNSIKSGTYIIPLYAYILVII